MPDWLGGTLFVVAWVLFLVLFWGSVVLFGLGVVRMIGRAFERGRRDVDSTPKGPRAA